MENIFNILFCNDLIPQVYKNNSYLWVSDVYNLSLSSKSMFNLIETFSKKRCQQFKDFDENYIIKYKKYGSWYNCLLFWECKFPKEVVRNLNRTSETFISVIPIIHEFSKHSVSYGYLGMNVYPSLEFYENKIEYHYEATPHEEYKEIEINQNRIYKRRIIIDYPQFSKFYDSVLKEIEDQTFYNYESCRIYLSKKGFFPIDLVKTERDFSNLTHFDKIRIPHKYYKGMKKSTAEKQTDFFEFVNSFWTMHSKKYDKIPKTIKNYKTTYYIGEETKSIIIGICTFFGLKPTFYNFCSLRWDRKISLFRQKIMF